MACRISPTAEAEFVGANSDVGQGNRETVDAVVVLGPQPFIAAARALFAASGHPYHNSLSRGQRGGRPRIYFPSAVPDNDALQGLLDILPHGARAGAIDERWGLLAVDESADEAAFGAGHDSSQLLTGLFSLLWDRLQSTSYSRRGNAAGCLCRATKFAFRCARGTNWLATN